MSQNPPQTLSVKRKRNEAPVDALIIEQARIVKKQKSQNLDARPKAQPSLGHFYRRLTKPNDAPQQSLAPPTPTAERRFYLDASARTQNKRVFVEEKAKIQSQHVAAGEQLHVPVEEPVSEEPSRPQKRPGASTAYRPTSKPQIQQPARTLEPSAHDVQQLEALSEQVEKEDNLHIPLPSPSKHKPKAPAQRFAQRHPEKAAALAAQEHPPDGDAMDIDGDEYVYDTYIRESILPDADGKLLAPTGTVGTLVIAEEDEDWWNGEDESDKEFDTDDEDENAEDYYANDYPEDELDEDDEYGRDLYQKKYRHGSDDEEFNAGSDEEEAAVGSGEDEDDVHFRMTVPKAQRAGYWGTVGEV
ncbi:hypothetical protein IQ06DRAFT_296429 [Phaeosphaeriaceae sp. SRC1lsM3a]|nr:hypothetical protein IQ06DRAFT_296429 [Stagonospora sp. SRC1lsM3a]